MGVITTWFGTEGLDTFYYYVSLGNLLDFGKFEKENDQISMRKLTNKINLDDIVSCK